MRILEQRDGNKLPAVVYGILVMLSLCVPPVLAVPGNVESGKTLYQRLCSTCHGMDGRGGAMGAMLQVPPRDLTQAEYMGTRSDADLFRAIHDGGTAVGQSSAMPAFAGQLREQEVWDTVAYVRTLGATTAKVPGQQTPTQATPDLAVARLRLQIWPEYDDPRLLIIMRGEMSPPQAFPTTITLPIPKGAEILGAGMITENNELVLHPHEILPGDTADSIAMKLPVPRFFLEFYYAPFQPKQANKRFTYAVPSGYPLTLLEVDIQQPRHATAFVIEPAAMEQASDRQGLMHYQFTYRDLTPGEAPQFTVSYTRTTTTPSVTKPPARTSSAAPAAIARVLSNTLQIALLILAVATVLFAGFAWWWRRQGRPQANDATAVVPVEIPATLLPPILVSGSQPVPHNFCTQCGAPLDPAHRFCARCGQAVPA